MRKQELKYLVDVLLFVSISSTAMIGLILAFIIPPGGGSHAEKVFLGLQRHAWGDIHLYLSLFLLALLGFHVWLSWTWVVESTKRYFGQNWKRFLWGLCGAWLVVLLIGRCVKG